MAAERSRTTMLTCRTFLAVNCPEIALTLEKCLIQGQIIVCFTWTEHFFMNYAIFLDIFKLSHVTSSINEGKPMDGDLKNKCSKRSVVWKNNKIWKSIEINFLANLLIKAIETSMKLKVTPWGCIFKVQSPPPIWISRAIYLCFDCFLLDDTHLCYSSWTHCLYI